MILLLHQSPPDVIAVSDLDLLVPAIGRSLFPALCDSVPVAIILITEREQDVLPSLCFQAAYVPIPIIVVSGDHMVPIGDLPDPILAVVPVPYFHTLVIIDILIRMPVTDRLADPSQAVIAEGGDDWILLF